MNNNIIKGLLGFCLLLLFILLIEWQLSAPVETVAVIPDKTKLTEQELMELPQLTAEKQTIESYSHMLERPLFIQGRKPVIDGVAEKAGEVASKIGDLTLLGIYSIKDKMFALFSQKGKEQSYAKKSKGEDVSGWRITEIKADRVLIEQRGKEQTLMLRKPKAEAKKLKSPRSKRRKIKLKS